MNREHRRLASRTWIACAALAVVGLASTAALCADQEGAAARDIQSKFGNAVVTVKVVAKVSMTMEGREMQEEEQTEEAKGTVLDGSGLVVCALSDVDPTHMVEMMSGGQPGFKWQADVTDVKIRPAEGKEMPAKIVLRDKDLDLAFVRPVEPPGAAMASLSFADAGEPQAADPVVILSRLGEVGNRASCVLLDRVQAVVEKPRRLYALGLSVHSSGLGCPVLLPDGKVVGLLVLRALPGAAGEQDVMPVVMPAQDVMRAAAQAPPA